MQKSWIIRQCFQTLFDYNLAWGLYFHSRFDDLDLVSRSQCVININCKLCVLDSCPLLFELGVVATCMYHILYMKMMHIMVCVTLVCIQGR